MNNIYEQYLSDCNVLTEEEFVDLLDGIPVKIKNATTYISFDPYDDEDEIAAKIIDGWLDENNLNASVVGVDLNNKQVSIDYYGDLQSLDLIIESLKGWTIENLDDIKQDIEDSDEQDSLRNKLLAIIGEKATIEQLTNFVNSL